MTKNIKAYAFDYPLVDLTIPQIGELTKQAKEKGINDDRLQYFLEERLKIVELIKDEAEPGQKITLKDKEKADKLIEMTLKLRAELLDEFKHDIAASGGTGANKLHTFKHVYEELSRINGENAKVETTLVGSFGQDKLAPLVKHYAEVSGTKTHPDIPLTEGSRASIILTLDGEKDRRAIKMPFDIPASAKDLKMQKKLSKDAGVVFLEATMIDRLGPINFIKFAEHLNKNNKFIVFSPPTEGRLFFDEAKQEVIKDNAVAFIKVARMSNIIAMNEEELQRFMGDYNPKERINSLEDKGFQDAVTKLRENMKDEKRGVNDDVISLVTFGKFGAGAYKAHSRRTAPAAEIPQDTVFYKIGAGDAFCASFAAFMVNAKNEKDINLKDNSLAFTLQLDTALRGAAEISAAVIQEPAAQIAPEKIGKVVKLHTENYKSPTNEISSSEKFKLSSNGHSHSLQTA